MDYVERIINTWDPIGLFPYSPVDEYHDEIDYIISGAIGGKGANAKGLSTAWRSASRGISREMRRANVKYATKQIAKYTAEKVAVKTSTTVAIGRLTFGTIGNAFVRWELGY